MNNRPALSLLLAGCTALGAVIFVEVVPGFREDAVLPERALRAESIPTTHRKQKPRADELLETALARPLFDSTRRPPQSTIEDGAADADFADKRLTGIVITSDRRLAVFAVNNAKPLILNEGESVSGWGIETIAPIEISLSSRAGNKTLRPSPDPALTRPPTAAEMRPNPPVPRNIPGLPPQRTISHAQSR